MFGQSYCMGVLGKAGTLFSWLYVLYLKKKIREFEMWCSCGDCATYTARNVGFLAFLIGIAIELSDKLYPKIISFPLSVTHKDDQERIPWTLDALEGEV